MQEKKLRDALEEIILCMQSAESYSDLLGHSEWLIDKAKAALASTTEETEMEKLVAWLKRELNDSIDRLNTARDREWRGEPVPEMERPTEYHAGQGNFCGYALDYITTQFGEEEGDADRGD